MEWYNYDLIDKICVALMCFSTLYMKISKWNRIIIFSFEEYMNPNIGEKSKFHTKGSKLKTEKTKVIYLYEDFVSEISSG